MGTALLESGAPFVAVLAIATAAVLLAKPYVPVQLLGSAYLLAIVPLALVYGVAVGLAAAVVSAVACAGFFFPAAHVPRADSSDALVITLFVAGALVGGRLRRSVTLPYERIVKDQATLRHIAALVGRRFSITEICTTIAREVALSSTADIAHVLRYEPNGTVSVVASWGDGALRAGPKFPLGSGASLFLDGPSVEALVHVRERPSRIEQFEGLPGQIAALVRASGIRCEVGGPIIVGGRVWGALVLSSRSLQPLPRETEERIQNFAELAGVAISHAETRAKLIESRARLVASADEAREKIERDLHDSVQQRLISVALRLRLGESLTETDELTRTMRAAEVSLDAVIAEIRSIVHGLLPPVLTQAGLKPALRVLARQAPVHTTVDVDGLPSRLPKEIEAATYYVVAEALANATKHAHATSVGVSLTVRGDSLRATVQDNGIGGADPMAGSGLSGLMNRAEALGGWLSVESRAGQGTTVVVELPLEGLGLPDAPRPAVVHRY